MAEPPKPRGSKAAKILAILAVFSLIGAFLVSKGEENPDPEPPPVTARDLEDATFVDSFNHPIGFRMLIPLARSTRTGKGTWFETTISFGYSVARENIDAARAAIKRNFNAAGTSLKQMLRTHERMDFVSDLEPITESVIDMLNEHFFPDEIANVETVSWERFEFRADR